MKVARLRCERCGHTWKAPLLKLDGGDCPACLRAAAALGAEPPRSTGVVKRLQTR